MVLSGLILLLIYFSGMLLLFFKHIKSSYVKTNFISKNIHLLVPVRNEASRLETLFRSIENNQFEKSKVTFVNDHSTDGSDQLIKSKGFKIIDLPQKLMGKKAALIYGAQNTHADFLLFNDADVSHYSSYGKIIEKVPFNGDFDICVLPVQIKPKNSILNRFITLDFSWLQFLTFSYSGNLSNGANLLVKRESYLKYSQGLEESILSGDDYFLIKSCRKQKGKIRYFNNLKFSVITEAPKNLFSLIDQRARWIQKSFLKGGIIEISSIICWIFISLTPYIFSYAWLETGDNRFLILLLTKFSIDLIVFIRALYFIKRLRLLYLLPLTTILYPFYYVLVVLRSGFKMKWKARDL